MLLLVYAGLALAGEETLLTPEQQQADYDELWAALDHIHPSLYLHTAEEDFAQIRAEVRERLTETRTTGGFWTVVMDSLTPIGCGHTVVYPPEDAVGAIAASFFPRDLVVIDDALYIDPRSHEDAGRVVSIQGVPGDTVLTQLRGLFLADALATPWQDYRIDALAPLWLPFLFDTPETWELVVEIDGAAVSQTLSGTPMGTYHSGNAPRALREEPRYLAFAVDPDTRGRFPATRKELKGRALSLNFDGFDDRSMKQAILKPLRAAIKAGMTGVILDLRRNGGGSPWPAFELFGHFIAEDERVYDQRLFRWPFYAEHRFGRDSTAYAALTSEDRTTELEIADGLYNMGYGDSGWVKARKPLYDGPVVVLTGGNTFSTGADLAALFKRFGRGQIVGTPAGGSGTLQTSGDEVALTLTHSGVRMWIPLNRSRLVDPDGRIGRAGPPPDHTVARTFEEIRDEEDPAFQKALDLLRAAQTP